LTLKCNTARSAKNCGNTLRCGREAKPDGVLHTSRQFAQKPRRTAGLVCEQ
jgi:hypothetical protein